MRAFWSDLRFGFRVLRKTPAFSLVAVAVLAVGIGANSAMVTIVNAVLLKPLAGQAGELVGLYSHDTTQPDSYRAFSYPAYTDVRDRSDVFDSLMAHNFALVGVGSNDAVRQTFVDVVTSNYFQTLGVPLAAGRTFTADEDRPGARIPVAIAGYDRAALLGRTITINTIDFTIVGVVPRGFTGTMALVAPELWLPMGMHDVVVNDIFKNKATGLQDRSNPTLIVAGRLKPGVTATVAAARLAALSKQLEAAYPADNRNQLLTINPLPRLGTSTSPRTNTGMGVAAALLLGLAGVVLLIACLNIANMLLARGTARRKELAIRLAIGGSRTRVIRQLLTEGLLLALGGAGVGLVLAFWATRALASSFERVLPMALIFDSRPDAFVLAATVACALVATAMFGIGPAFKLSRVDLIDDLKELGGERVGRLGRRFSGRNILVVAQVALSLMLLSAGGLFARGALKAASANPGFGYTGQLLVTIDPGLARYDEPGGRAAQRRALDAIRSIPGVANAAMASTVPFGDFHEDRHVERVGATPDTGSRRGPVFRIVSGGYFKTLGLPMLRGREFTTTEETSPNAPRVAIIDGQLARRLFGEEDPLGQLIRFRESPGEESVDTTPMQIVGIAPPIRDDLFEHDAPPAIYVPAGRNYRAMMNIHARVAQPGAERQVLDDIRRVLRDGDPQLPVLKTTTMTAFHDGSLPLWIARAGGRLFMVFGLLALGLAVVGLYGVKSYLVAQRTREIGIRMALGADRGAVLRMVLKDGAVLAGAGIVVGLPLAAILGRLLASLLYDVRPIDPLVFTAAPLLLGAAALVASWLPARRATHVTPVTALRS